MKLAVANIEKLIIKYIVSTRSDTLAHFALSKVNSEHFASNAAAELYGRIFTVSRVRGDIPSFEELISDPVVTESSRHSLANFKKNVRHLDKTQVEYLIERLDHYRKIRKLFYGAEELIKALRKDKVDVDKLIKQQSEVLSQAKANSIAVADIFNYGENNNTSFLVKRMLEGHERYAIPTGFSGFDNINRGIFLGSLLLLAAPSGSGKSVMALTITKNMAEFGAKVCYIPLEQNGEEIHDRLMANIASIDMSKINNPKTMTKEEKARYVKSYKKWTKSLKRKKARLTVWKPTEDISMEDILFHMQPLGFNVVAVDYLSLTKDVGGDDQWQKLGEAARKCKVFADNTKSIVIIVAQLSEEMQIRFSKVLIDHSVNAWFWVRDKAARESRVIPIIQRKARNQKDHTFEVFEEFQYMRMSDLPENLSASEDNCAAAPTSTSASTSQRQQQQDQSNVARKPPITASRSNNFNSGRNQFPGKKVSSRNTRNISSDSYFDDIPDRS